MKDTPKGPIYKSQLTKSTGTVNSVDDLLRNQWFWLGLLILTLILPPIMSGWAELLIVFFILIPFIHVAFRYFLMMCGIPVNDLLSNSYTANMIYMFGFHAFFWTLFGLISMAKKLSPVVLRIVSCLFIIILATLVLGGYRGLLAFPKRW